uniref:Uncharacterized protein n=1 Tax=Arundo donax TaxID=35708 RepID=A0A0A9BWZ1_ARUDO
MTGNEIAKQNKGVLSYD